MYGVAMADPNLVDFYGRVARIEKARTKGYAHEAAGTLGRSSYLIPAKRRRSFLGPPLFLALCAFGLKGGIYHSIGAEAYTQRVEQLKAGEGFDRVGGWLMQADPVTQFVAQKITLVRQGLK